MHGLCIENILTHPSQGHGGPTLDWFEIQPEFKYCNADVLLILDCCYAAQSARARGRANRVELLAACSMGLQTPRPGPKSFTSRLMIELNAAASASEPVNTAMLAQRLARIEAKLVQSPYYLPLQAEEQDKPILLQPLPRHDEVSNSPVQNACLLTFHVSLSKELTMHQLPTIVRWLKDGAPDMVSGMSVAGILAKSEKMHEFVSKARQVDSSPLFANLDDQARKEITRAWSDLCNFIANTNVRPDGTSLEGDDSSSAKISLISPSVETYFIRLHEMNQRMSRAIQGIVLSCQNLTESTELDAIADDELIQSVGLANPLRVRMAVVSPAEVASDLQMPDSIAAEFEKMARGSNSLVDYRYYEAKDGAASLSMIAGRIKQLAALLNRSTVTDFRTLYCRGWVHEPSFLRFGLVFDVPDVFEATPYTLNDLIKTTKGSQRPPLEKRFEMALKLGRAVQAWHAVGWLHQNIGGRNIILFRLRDVTDIDYDSPFLCGFEFARPNSAYSIPRGQDVLELDLYRHPDRQGEPQRPHRKEDDLYSFGILLLELGLWQTASSMLGIHRSSTRPSAVDIRQKLIDSSRQRLSHYMGTAYSSAVDVCLNGDLELDIDDRSQTRLARAFEERVLACLETNLQGGIRASSRYI